MECKICLQNYNDTERAPHTLSPCGHCFCLQCLKKLPRKLCPMDRRKFELKVINRAILDILSTQAAPCTSNTSKNAKIVELKSSLLDEFENMGVITTHLINKKQENSKILFDSTSRCSIHKENAMTVQSSLPTKFRTRRCVQEEIDKLTNTRNISQAPQGYRTEIECSKEIQKWANASTSLPIIAVMIVIYMIVFYLYLIII